MANGYDATASDPWHAFRLPPGQRAASVAQPAANDPYAAFRVPQPAAAPVDEWAAFRKPAAAPDSTALDVAKSVGAGAITGLTELAMTPATLPKLLADGIRKVTGVQPLYTPESPGIGGAISRGFQAVDNFVGQMRAEDAALHTPQTTAGRYAGAVAEFAPSVVAGPGGIMRKTLEAAVPAVMSEGAGDLAKGTAAEPYARVAAGVLGSLGAAVPQFVNGSAERIVSRAVAGTDPAAFRTAQQLQEQALAMGVPLSGPEAIQAATQGATKLGDVQRVVEGSTRGGAATGQFYAQRPDQVADAVARSLDQIAPAPLQPSTLGQRAAGVAQGAIDDVRRGINTATAPAYQAAGAHVLAPQDFAPIQQDAAFRASLDRLRSDPVLGPTYQAMPDASVAVIDAVTKDMRDRSVALGNAANPGFSAQTASIYGTGAAEARDIARDPLRGGVQAYDDALTAQAQARRQNLNPLEQGPLGGVAGATTTQGAYDALLPPTPLSGGHGEIGDAAPRLHAADPDVVPALIRQSLADRADAALRDNVGGPNQAGGALFRKTVAGTDQQRQNLAAALGSTGRSTDLPALLDVLQATGWRKPQGSATEFNRQMAGDLGRQGLPAAAVQAVATGGLGLPSLLGGIAEGARAHALDRNAGRLADLFLAPDSATQLAAIAARGVQSPLVDVLARRLPMQVSMESQSR